MMAWTTVAWLLLASGPVTPVNPVIEQLRLQLETQPESLDLWLSLSRQQEQAGLLDEALASANKALAIADVYDTRLRLGWLLLSDERCPEALNHYRAASQHSPESEDPLLGQQACLVKQENFQAAVDVGERLLGLNPDNLWGQKRQAYALFMLGQYEPSAAQYSRVLQEAPDDAEMRLGLGLSNLRMGMLEQGRHQCSLAAEKLRDDPRVAACLEAAEPPGVIFASSLHSGWLDYSGDTNQGSLASFSLAVALVFPGGFELATGLMLTSAEDYLQYNPVLSLAYTGDSWYGKAVFTYLFAVDRPIPDAYVLSTIQRMPGGLVDIEIGFNASWYGRMLALQVAPGLRWHLSDQADLITGFELISTWARARNALPGSWGANNAGWLFYPSGRLGLDWRVLDRLNIIAGVFYGLRRFAVDDEGWSVWNNDDRFVAGYQIGTTIKLSQHWTLFAEFRHLFADQEGGQDADFMLLGGVFGLRAWY